MKPKFFSALKNFTVPAVNRFSSHFDGSTRAAKPEDTTLSAFVEGRRWSYSNAPLPRAKTCHPSHAHTTASTNRQARDCVTRATSAGSVINEGRRVLITA